MSLNSPDKKSIKTKTVSREKWDAARAFLKTKREPTGTLSSAERRALRETFRGPFYRGFRETDAHRLLDHMGWRVG